MVHVLLEEEEHNHQDRGDAAINVKVDIKTAIVLEKKKTMNQDNQPKMKDMTSTKTADKTEKAKPPKKKHLKADDGESPSLLPEGLHHFNRMKDIMDNIAPRSPPPSQSSMPRCGKRCRSVSGGHLGTNRPVSRQPSQLTHKPTCMHKADVAALLVQAGPRSRVDGSSVSAASVVSWLHGRVYTCNHARILCCSHFVWPR